MLPKHGASILTRSSRSREPGVNGLKRAGGTLGMRPFPGILPRMSGDSATTRTASNVLIIEDDDDIREVVAMQLREANYTVFTATHGAAGLSIARDHTISLVVLDLGLPATDGLDVCRALMQLDPKPLVLMLTARATEIDRVRGLDVGADDYVVKPFSVLELAARVRALLRRAGDARATAADPTVRTVRAGRLEIDRWERCARLGARRIELTAREFELLQWFVKSPQRVFSRTELLDGIWGQGYEGFEHTVNSHLNRLRAKLEVDPSQPKVLVTVRGGGYKLVPPDDPDSEHPNA